MVALSRVAAGTRGPAPRPARARRVRWGRGTFLTLVALYFALPLYAAFRFALTRTGGGGFTLSAFTGLPRAAGFGTAVWLSTRLGVLTLAITLALMVPTAVLVHLEAPQLRRLFDGITLLPIVIPPVILIVGVLQVAPGALKSSPYLLSLEYAVLAMPFAYRSLDAGLAAIDLKTLVEASRSLGGSWARTLLDVVVPNLRSALLSATVLTVALVLGEFTMAQLDQYETFPVWIYDFDQQSGPVSTAASLLALVVTWVLLVGIVSAGGRRGRTRSGTSSAARPTGGPR